MKRVVVTGLGAVTPIGKTLNGFREGLKNGISGAVPITQFDCSLFKTQFACEVSDLDISEHFNRKDARKLDRFTQLAIIAADEAIADSGILEIDQLDVDRVGVIWGAGIGGLKSISKEITAFATGNGTPRFNPFFIPKMIIDIASGHISIKHGFRGVNYSTVSACATSTHAIIASADSIRLGRADIIVTGGSEATIVEAGIGGFNSMKALSTRNDDPKTASRPFDLDRDGFVMGEGAGGLILEEYEHAKARGAKIYAELVGTGMTADAYHITAPHPEGIGAANVMKNALKEAGLNPSDVDYVNVHGTSTPLGDIAELNGILKVFGDDAYNLNISSTKSMTGHLLGAAGAIEAIAGILAIQDNFVPPTINHFTDDPNIDSKLNLTFNTAQERKVNTVLSNTFGFGGHNASVIFKGI
jgi:3-oxoacyl-[acyl-carrier-protein] synthase II